MAGVWQRHPRYTIMVTVALLITLYLLVPYTPQSGRYFMMQDSSLQSRVQRSHAIYDTLLKDRKQLIKKFGPEPKDIQLFPEDKAPWPPYTVWDFFPAAFNCPHEIQRLGALGDGGKWVCGLSRVAEKNDCIVYSFGINKESSFEYEILQGTSHCQIWGYDFSVDSFGPEIPTRLSHRTHFSAYGLSGADKHSPGDNPPMWTLESLMARNGHEHIDILKIDIEGWEFETLTTLIRPYIASGKPLPFGQLQLEIHLWNKSFEEFLKWWEMLEEAGLRPFWTEPNLVYLIYNNKAHTPDLAEYSFLNVKGNNVFIQDAPPAHGERSGHPHAPN
ncbi:methyltransferase domain-containing protein [Panaeolus papilionaceus]|nr:methyltransferase domain-containing protein [Panaeolus papilionaceus]